MTITYRPTEKCWNCGEPTTGHIEIRSGEPEPVPVCSRCWCIDVTKTDLPAGTRAAVVDREADC